MVVICRYVQVVNVQVVKETDLQSVGLRSSRFEPAVDVKLLWFFSSKLFFFSKFKKEGSKLKKKGSNMLSR